METPWHALAAQDVFARLESSSQGLREEEILARRAAGGSNTLPEQKRNGRGRLLAHQFTSPMIVVLLVAGVISLALHELVDASVIAAAVAVNTLIGFVQEYKANRALAELRSLIQPESAVRRDGREQIVPASALVPGDVLVLHAGDRVSADARLLEVVDLLADEAALTGESFPVRKTSARLDDHVPLSGRANMVYAGTSVVGGRGLAVVVEIGAQTELGRIARLVEETPEIRTPLQEQLGRLARALAVLVLALVAILFVLGVASGRSLFEMFEMSVALAVAAIPEGLVISVTVILAIGMQRILHRKALVRRLVAAETLGSVSVICSDKTGTITQGEMRVTHLITPKQRWTYPFPLGEEPHSGLRTLFEAIALNNDAVYTPGDPDSLRGSPTERALMQVVLEQKLDAKTLSFQHPRVWEIPFDSAHKYMVTAHASPAKRVQIFLKGAPDVVLGLCTRVQEDGGAVKLTPARQHELQEEILSLTGKGTRLIAVATRTLDASSSALTRQELGAFTFVGFVGLRDPLRAEVRQQIKQAREAGIRTVMLTGDHPQTARAIGAEAGLEIDPESVVVGSQLDEWSDEELQRRVPRVSIFARVEPRHKIRIVNAWQARGEVVAMTGDGVNDAPALKAADIGVAVGSGTQVAKQASDIVILDNNLGTITAAIEEGRVMFDNVRKTTVYLLSGSFTELLLIGGALLLGLPLPLLAAQILWINLVSDAFPAIGLTIEPAEQGIMRQPPRVRGEPILDALMLRLVFIIALATNLILFALYFWLLAKGQDAVFVRSMMFAAVGLDTLIYVFAVKSFRTTLFRMNPFSNPWLVAAVAIGFGLMLLALFHPFFQAVFEIAPLRLSDLGLLLMIGVFKLVLIEIAKELFLIQRRPAII